MTSTIVQFATDPIPTWTEPRRTRPVRLRGETGTSVGATVQRPKTGETVDVMIERGAIVR